MLLLLLNFLFNVYQLIWLYAFGSVLIGYWVHIPKLSDNTLIALSCSSILLAILIGMSSLSELWFRLFFNLRSTVNREKAQLDPLLQEVLTKATVMKGLTSKIHRPKIMIIETTDITGMALGRNTIILSSGLLTMGTNEEIQAIMAHELAHLYYWDSVLAACLLFSSLPTAFLLWLYSWYNRLSSLVNRIMPLNALWQVILFLAFLPILILEFVGRWLFKIAALYLSRRCEYRADKFAATLGYKNSLIALLEKTQAMSETNNSLFGIMLSAHPAPIKRIDKLEGLP